MKFDRLTSSIALNASEEPTVYMTMCMVQSLFQDVESASKKPLSQTKLGDEQLPALLTWLGRQLVKIYTENSDELLRNRDRLEKMMEKVREQEKSLSEMAEVANALSAVKARFAELAARLDEAEEKQEETERLENACRQVREQLEVLEAVDPTQVREELRRLSEREHQLQEQHSELTNELEGRRGSVSELERECEELRNAAAQSQARLQALTSNRQTAETALAELNEAIANEERQLGDGAEQKDKLIAERAYLEQQILQLRNELGSYEQVYLTPLRTEQGELVQKQKAAGAELEALRKGRDDAVYQVARLSEQLTAAKQNLEEKQNDLQLKQEAADRASTEADQLQKQLEAATERLARSQQEAAEIEHERLPQLESHLTEQDQQNKQLEAAVAALEQRKEKLLLEEQRLRQDDESLKAEVARLSETHDALIASSEANSEEVKRLRQNVEALKGKNDQEKERRYLQQLNEEKDQLTALSQRCDDLERQIAAAQNELERKTAQVRSLQEKKDAEDQATQRINSLTLELAPHGEAALQRRVFVLQNRVHQLEEIHNSLEESVKLMQTSMGIQPRSLTPDPDSLSDALENCGRAFDKLQKSMVLWADDIKSSMKMNTIMEEL